MFVPLFLPVVKQDFAAGADLKELSNAQTIQMMQRRTEKYWQAIAQCSKPVIAAVNGYAHLVVDELAMHADIIIAGKSAQFGQPEVKVGVIHPECGWNTASISCCR